MSRMIIKLRQRPDGAIERQVQGNADWVVTELSEAMHLGGDSTQDLKSFLFELIDRELEELNWELRLSRQRAIGRDLHRILFEPHGIGDPGQWIHIVPEIGPGTAPSFLDLICRIPWPLLTRGNDETAPFLALDELEPVAITIDAAPERSKQDWFSDIKFPPYPRVLLIIPQVTIGEPHPTGGDLHRTELEAALAPRFSAAGLAGNLKTIRSFKEFQDVMSEPGLEPHVVYFYGHGLTEGFGTQLQFENEGKPDWRSADEVRRELDKAVQRTHFPPVVWLNACLGGAAEQDSALRLLSSVSACVITTRSVVAARDSRQLAVTALPMIVAGGWAPPSALREAQHRKPLTVRAARWATTMVSVQYDSWSALSAEDRLVADLDSAGNFPMRLDRVEALRTIADHLASQLATVPQTPLPVLWHGPVEQGLDAFEERISERLTECFPSWLLQTRRIELQPDVVPKRADARIQHFLDSVFYGLMNIVPTRGTVGKTYDSRIQNALANMLGGRCVLVLSHGPFEEGDVPLIQDYVSFWQTYGEDIRPAGRTLCIVLGFGLCEPGLAITPNFPGSLIVPLGPVSPRELEEHLRAYRSFYRVPSARIAQRAQELVDLHTGRFDRIRRALECLARLCPCEPETTEGG